MSKVYKNLATKEDRLWWQFVENTAEKVRAWPAWKRGETTEKAIPELRWLVEKRAFLEGCELAAKEELENKTEELEARRKKVLSELKSEIKDYRQKIKHIEKLINKTRKNSGKSESPATGCLGSIGCIPYHMDVPHKCTLIRKTKNKFGKDGFLKPKNKKN